MDFGFEESKIKKLHEMGTLYGNFNIIYNANI